MSTCYYGNVFSHHIMTRAIYISVNAHHFLKMESFDGFCVPLKDILTSSTCEIISYYEKNMCMTYNENDASYKE